MSLNSEILCNCHILIAEIRTLPVGMFQSIMKTIKLDALPDGGRKLHDEVLYLSENLRLLDIQINCKKSTQSDTLNGHSQTGVLDHAIAIVILSICLSVCLSVSLFFCLLAFY